MRFFRLLINIVCVLFLCLVSFGNASASGSNWVLTDDQRRDFLEYYAPIILKRGNGNKGDHGRDWITNFDFDRDWSFSDNGREWRNIDQYINDARAKRATSRQQWQIRPTLYTSLMEYKDGSQKNLILFYHVYHAMDQDAKQDYQLHDWERVEIHIQNVNSSGKPGSGDSIKFAVITQHSRSVMRRPSSRDFNTLSSSTGNHLLLWQAEWSGKLLSPHGQELRFIEDSWAYTSYRMSRNKDAEVEIIGTSKDKNVHYAFVPEGSASAVAAFRARKLNWESAASLTSYYDNGKTARWSAVPRITYELQDIADIIPTNWSGSNYSPHWTREKSERILIDTPFKNRDGKSISGLQTFYTKTFDLNHNDIRSGYPAKSWLWGVYEIRDVCQVSITKFRFCLSKAVDFKYNSYNSIARDDYGQTRITANKTPNSKGSYWYQHDYFVHSGVQDNVDGTERGKWLPKGWNLAQNGGFDGRWVQLFDDGLDKDPVYPLQVAITGPSSGCIEYARLTSRASSGKPPYTHKWYIGGHLLKSTVGDRATQIVMANRAYNVVVTDSGGQTQSRRAYFQLKCTGNTFLR